MMATVKNLWALDLALIELFRHGRTDAPREVLAQLEFLGHVVVGVGRKLTLTAKGRKRAERLRGAEQHLRASAAAEAQARATGRMPLRTDARFWKF
jgi:hypothetical protein